MILVTTIWHTGTHSLMETFEDHERRKQSGEIRQVHCNSEALKLIDRADEIVMTYRSPMRVAASWVNRGRLPKAPFQRDRTWNEQWRIYAEIAPRAARIVSVDDLGYRLNTTPDTYGLHAMLSAGDIGLFFAYVPRQIIEFSYDRIRGIAKHLPHKGRMTG